MGYGMRDTSSKNWFLYTKSKKVNYIVGLALQVTVEPKNNSSNIVIAGKFVAIDSTGKEETDSRKWVWMKYGTDNPLQRQLWDEVHQIVVQLFPRARISYY